MDYNLERIGNNLKKLRIKRKWKFAYISKQTEIDEDRLRRMEESLAIPNYKELYKLSRLYDVTLDELVLNKIE